MPGFKSRLSPLVPALALALFAGACDTSETVGVRPDDAAASDVTTLKILLTDAPADYVAEANVDIGRVEILPVDGPAIVLTEDGTDGFVNLLELQKSATMQIAQNEVDPGMYHQLRLVVEGANVKLKEGYTFRDGSTTQDLKVPSGAQTGIKLLLRDGDGEHLELVPGEKVIVLDFDVNQSFVIQGNPETPAGIKSMSFKPTIRVTGMDVAASISGNVSTLLDGVSVESRVVMAEPTDAGDLTEYGYQTETGTALTDENGDYTIFFLVPGEYEVSVALDPELDRGLGTEPESHTLRVGWSENATGVDFEIIDITGSISGTVSVAEGIDGVELEGLEVTATPTAEGEAPVTVTTAADGTYTIDDLLPDSYTVEVAFEQEGLAMYPASQDVDVGRQQDVTDVDFIVVAAGSIRGTVSLGSDVEGVSVEGLTVTATADGQDPVNVVTDTNGAYLFTDLAAATWTITVTVPEGYVTVPGTLTVVLEEGTGFAHQDFVIEEED